MASRLYAYTLRRTLRVVGIVIAVLLLVAGAVFGFVRLFSIRQIEVDGNGLSIELDRTKLGDNLLFIPTDRLTRDLLNNYPFLSDVRFEKRLPGTLIIHLVKRQPFAILETKSARYELDTSGTVLDNAKSTAGYPLLRFDEGPLAIGSRVVDPKVLGSLAFLEALKGAIQIESMGEKDSASVYAIMGKTNIFLPQTTDMRAKADTLQTIIEGFRIKGTLPTVIDLRFEKPIVTN
jgi:cell division septal protein FtsQ